MSSVIEDISAPVDLSNPLNRNWLWDGVQQFLLPVQGLDGGQFVYDLVGDRYPGTLVQGSGTASWADSQFGPCVNLSGSKARIDAVGLPRPTSITLAVAFMSPSLTGIRTLAVNRVSSVEVSGVTIYLNGATAHLLTSVGGGWQTDLSASISSVPTLAVITFSEFTGVQTLTVNGIQVTNTVTAAPLVWLTGGGRTWHWCSDDSGNSLVGTFYWAAIFDRALPNWGAAAYREWLAGWPNALNRVSPYGYQASSAGGSVSTNWSFTFESPASSSKTASSPVDTLVSTNRILRVPNESLASATCVEIIPADWITEIAKACSLPIEWPKTVSSAGTITLELTASVQGTRSLGIDWSTYIAQTATIPTESLGAAAQQAFACCEWLSAQSGGMISPMQWQGTLQAAGIIPVEWGGVEPSPDLVWIADARGHIWIAGNRGGVRRVIQ